ncbi:ABC transporter ATP-binding protein [Desertibacillus haloalkaliphilus]|uniref:ABC transporter ATP-binding protein n=1 Tax=Desertibacillus haloalkaliphilus TaxID=1328930 RepID=UPI001C27FA86|nr:ABC transporter ATP-binding protein [Desertibacillus haloalkaliphilus]MBU8905436.1 ABC transporter ATP-binding protein [Desertibacillus haloalkaliphilus]
MSLRINHVTKQYGNVTAVDQLTLEIQRNQMFGVLGANGAGKTTTFRMILGLLDPSEGEITWNGQTIAKRMNEKIGYLPEERGLYPKLKVVDQLVYLGRLRGMKKRQVIDEMKLWLDRFHVPEYANKRVEELSKGNQQKVQFIASVIHKPELLILDEPFSGLDPVNVELLKKAVLALKEQGTTILFSSHRMEHVEELCEHLCILHKGKAVVHGNLRDVKRSHRKKNVMIHADFSLEFLKEMAGVLHYRETQEGAILQIADESVSQHIFQAISGFGFVRKFELEEPSLNDIFIERVGTEYE